MSAARSRTCCVAAGTSKEQDIEDDDLFDALSAYICTENFEEREQERDYLDLAVLEYMKEKR
jgi:hypothetical protein